MDKHSKYLTISREEAIKTVKDTQEITIGSVVISCYKVDDKPMVFYVVHLTV